ncbi:hypothetical protein RF11_11041 [Thelohanellus kitauei]|uniref:Uncharacterized protein n=1 Tax=Thelohanellus kitauei TaxID=669202 RepID=A0A0C2JJ36_THEKT|nr:hypothetical protein RF11_11041 [Thelohanellus kitauei]
MLKINKHLRISEEAIFEPEDIPDFEFEENDYSEISKSIVVKVDDSEKCGELFDSLLESIPAQGVKFHVVKEATRSDTKFTSADIETCKSMHGSVFEGLSQKCEQKGKNCLFSCFSMKNGRLNSLLDYSKTVEATHVIDLPKLTDDKAVKIYGTEKTVNVK